MNIVRLMLLSRQMKNRRHEKDNMVTGIPPLTFNAIAGSLKNYRIYGNTETKTRSYSGSAPLSFPIVDGGVSNYRIYGNTVNGESVGDKTENLFDMKKFAETCYPRYASVTFVNNTLSFTTTANDAYVNIVYGEGTTVDEEYRPSCVDVLPSTTYTISMSSAPKCYISWVDDSFTVVSAYTRIPQNQSSYTFTTPSNCTKLLIRLGKEVANIGDTFTISDIMLNSGSTALPYEPYGYRIPITNNSETANIYLNEPLRMVEDETEYVDYATQKQHRVRKNLLQNIATSQTRNGVTFTVNSDGSVTCNGTASATIDYRMVALNSYSLPAGNYRLTGAPPTANYSSYYLRAWYNSSGSVKGVIDIGNGTNFSLTDTTILLCAIIIASQQVLNNVTFYPMIRKAGIEDDTYEPYIENTEVDVTLPALPAQSSTNSFSVGTIIQPSSVAVDVGEVVSCGDKVTDSQSVNYGKYKIPVTLTADSAETTDIYLDAPLAKSGNGADYIDYATQKRRNSDGTESSVTLPEIAVTAGTNTFTIGTEVQPSRVELTGRIKEAQTNGSGNT